MTGQRASRVALLVFAVCGPACSDDGGAAGSGVGENGGSGAEAGNSGSAGSSAGAAGSSGSSGSGGAAGQAGRGGTTGQAGSGGAAGSTAGTAGAGPGGHCSPGVVYAESRVWDGELRLCDRYDFVANGIPSDGDPSVRQIQLPEPMVVGGSHTLSIAVRLGGGQTVELWGTSASCGRADEKLFTGTLAGVVCAELTPPKLAHTSLLMVWRGEGSVFIGDMTVCLQGTCP